MKSALKLLFPFLMFMVLACDTGGSLAEKRGMQQTAAAVIKLTHSKDLVAEGSEFVEPIVISPYRLLVPVGDTLYMLNSKSQIEWKVSFGVNGIIIGQPIIDSSGTIYVAAGDGILAAVDSSGNMKWRDQMNGAANYRQIVKYKDDQFLTVIDLEGYREKGSNSEDLVSLHNGREILWEKDFPKDAELQVWVDKILAIVKSSDGVEIKRIE